MLQILAWEKETNYSLHAHRGNELNSNVFPPIKSGTKPPLPRKRGYFSWGANISIVSCILQLSSSIAINNVQGKNILSGGLSSTITTYFFSPSVNLHSSCLPSHLPFFSTSRESREARLRLSCVFLNGPLFYEKSIENRDDQV